MKADFPMSLEQYCNHFAVDFLETFGNDIPTQSEISVVEDALNSVLAQLHANLCAFKSIVNADK